MGCLAHAGESWECSPGVTPNSPPETGLRMGELGVGWHPRVWPVLCRTTGGAGGTGPLPGHLSGLDLPLLLGPLPRCPHGHPRGQLLLLGPDQQVGRHQPQRCQMHALSGAFVGPPWCTCPHPSRLASCCPLHSTYSELSSCTQLLAQLLSCPWPSAILDAFFLQVHAEYFTNCTRAGPSRLGGLPPRMAVAVAVGLSCLVPLAAAPTLTRAQKGAQTPAGSCPAPACLCACEGLATAPFPPSPGN